MPYVCSRPHAAFRPFSDVLVCHLAPPCGTSSKARKIPAETFAPAPLRDAEFPDGFPTLQGQNAARVQAANVLYSLTGSILMHCFAHGVLISISIENPANSWFWLVSGMTKAQRVPALSTYLRHCMFGSARKKHTKLLHLSKVRGGGGFEPRFNPGSNSGAGSEGGRPNINIKNLGPRFNPGSTQVQPRFNPGSTQVQPRFNPV